MLGLGQHLGGVNNSMLGRSGHLQALIVSVMPPGKQHRSNLKSVLRQSHRETNGLWSGQMVSAEIMLHARFPPKIAIYTHLPRETNTNNWRRARFARAPFCFLVAWIICVDPRFLSFCIWRAEIHNSFACRQRTHTNKWVGRGERRA